MVKTRFSPRVGHRGRQYSWVHDPRSLHNGDSMTIDDAKSRGKGNSSSPITRNRKKTALYVWNRRWRIGGSITAGMTRVEEKLVATHEQFFSFSDRFRSCAHDLQWIQLLDRSAIVSFVVHPGIA